MVFDCVSIVAAASRLLTTVTALIGALFDYRHKHSNRLMPPGVEFLLLLS